MSCVIWKLKELYISLHRRNHKIRDRFEELDSDKKEKWRKIWNDDLDTVKICCGNCRKK